MHDRAAEICERHPSGKDAALAELRCLLDQLIDEEMALLG
jgi:hypothetical protein